MKNFYLKKAKEYEMLADAMRVLALRADDPLKDEEPTVEEETTEVSLPTLEEIRGILIQKKRDGFNTEVKNLISKYQATKLSDINPSDYSALYADAIMIGGAV